MTIESILGVVYAKDEDYLLLKNSNFRDFIQFLPSDTIQQYVESKKLVCPTDLNSVNFTEWIDYGLKRLGKKRAELVDLCEVDKTKFSKYMNGKGPLDENHKIKIRGHIRDQLKSAGLIKDF